MAYTVPGNAPTKGLIVPRLVGVENGTAALPDGGVGVVGVVPGLLAPEPPPPPAQATNCRTTVAKRKLRFIL